jgi:DUF438 domain-containing protein
MNSKVPVMYEVRRTFPSAEVLRVGDLVDAANWRNRALLERQGYIKEVPQKKSETKTDKIEEKKTAEVKEDKPEPAKKTAAAQTKSSSKTKTTKKS